MATEKSFVDRLGRARSMHAAINLFTPAFAPADAKLLPATFNTFLDSLATLNSETSELLDQYKDKVGERGATVKDITKRATRVLAYVKSNVAWEKHLRTIKSIVDKITGFLPPADELKIGNLKTLLTGYHDLNTLMHDLGIQLGNKQKERFAAYNDGSGLKPQMKAIKEAAKSQYGTTSPEYASVKSLAL